MCAIHITYMHSEVLPVLHFFLSITTRFIELKRTLALALTKIHTSGKSIEFHFMFVPMSRHSQHSLALNSQLSCLNLLSAGFIEVQ